MAINKKISQLNPLSVSADTDLFAIVDTGSFETKKITRNDLMASPGSIGDNNPDTAAFTVLTVGSTPVDDFSTDIDLGNSDTTIPTQNAVKSYVDNAVGNAVKLNIRHVNIDTTAVIGDIVLVDTTNGDIDIELVPTGEGKIVVYKKSLDSNVVSSFPALGSVLDGTTTSKNLSIPTGSYEFVCDGVNFYTI